VASLMASFPPEAQSVHIQVDDGSGIESEHLAKDQSAYDRDSKRAPEFGTDAPAQRQAAIVVIRIGRKRSRQA
jgi:hypothetical protein